MQQGREAWQRQRQTTAKGQKGKGKAQEKGHVGTWQRASMDLHVVNGPSMSGGSSPIVSAWAPLADNYISSNNSTSFHWPRSFISEGDLWISNPSLMPDYLSSLLTPKAIDKILYKMSLEMISSLSYQQDIHCLPATGVKLSN